MEEKRSRDTPSLRDISTGTGTTLVILYRISANFFLSLRLLAKKIQPPFKPSVVRFRVLCTVKALAHVCFKESVLDVANFDPDFTNEEAHDSVVTDSALSETVQDQFIGFTYNPANEHLSESVSYPSGL